MQKIDGRKFILALISLGFIIGVFIYMAFQRWLTPEYCMRILGMLPIIIGLFVGGNVLEKYIKKESKT